MIIWRGKALSLKNSCNRNSAFSVRPSTRRTIYTEPTQKTIPTGVELLAIHPECTSRNDSGSHDERSDGASSCENYYNCPSENGRMSIWPRIPLPQHINTYFGSLFVWLNCVHVISAAPYVFHLQATYTRGRHSCPILSHFHPTTHPSLYPRAVFPYGNCLSKFPLPQTIPISAWLNRSRPPASFVTRLVLLLVAPCAAFWWWYGTGRDAY